MINDEELIKAYIQEASKVIMNKPEDFSKSYQDKAGKIQKSLTDRGIVQNDRTKVTDPAAVLEEIALAAGPNVFIRFENQYSKKTPTFSVSPVIQYDTPHGLYAYPFDKHNLINLIENKSPTKAEFAADYTHFHIFKSNMTKTEIVSRKKEEIQTKYTSSEIVKQDVKEAFRSFSMLIKYNKSLIETQDQKKQIIQKILSEISSAKQENIGHKHISAIDYDFPESISKIINENNYFFKSKKGDYMSIFSNREIVSAFSDFFFVICSLSFKKKDKRLGLSSKVTLFRIVKKTIEILSVILGKLNDTRRGQYYSLLLHIVGIDGIEDKGTSFIHSSEPTQFVSHDFQGENVEVIGTYKNIFMKRRSAELFEMLISAAEKPENKKRLNWVWDTKKSFKQSYGKGEGNLSESDFMKLLNKEGEIPVFVYCAIAENLNVTANVHLKVLETFNQKYDKSDKETYLQRIIADIANNPYTDEKVLEYIIKNEETDYKNKEKIAKHKNSNEETKQIANSFSNTLKKYVGKVKDFF